MRCPFSCSTVIVNLFFACHAERDQFRMAENVFPGHSTSLAARIGSRAREHAVSALRKFADRQSGGAPFRLVSPDGTATEFGRGDPVFTLRVHSSEGLSALASLDALTIAHAYMDGKLDFEGNLFEVLRYQEFLLDTHPIIYLWRRLHL